MNHPPGLVGDGFQPSWAGLRAAVEEVYALELERAAKGDIKVSRAATGVERCADARASQRHVCEMHAQLRAGGPGEERPLWQLNDEGTRLAELAVDEVAETWHPTRPAVLAQAFF